jgi:hypothetical protein
MIFQDGKCHEFRSTGFPEEDDEADGKSGKWIVLLSCLDWIVVLVCVKPLRLRALVEVQTYGRNK